MLAGLPYPLSATARRNVGVRTLKLAPPVPLWAKTREDRVDAYRVDPRRAGGFTYGSRPPRAVIPLNCALP